MSDGHVGPAGQLAECRAKAKLNIKLIIFNFIGQHNISY